jgi:hypothetical protein
MNEFEIYKNFLNKNFSDEEIISLLPEETIIESEDKYPFDTLKKKDADIMVAKRIELEKKIKDGTLTEKDVTNLTDKILFSSTSIPISKSARSTLLKQVREYDHEKDPVRKMRLAKIIAFDAIKIIDEHKGKFEAEEKRKQVEIDASKGKNDQIPIKRDILQNTLAPKMSSLKGKIDKVKKIFSNTDDASEYTTELLRSSGPEYANMRKDFKSMDEVAKYWAQKQVQVYFAEFFESSIEQFKKAYQDALAIIEKVKKQGKDPQLYLDANQWTALLLKQLRDFKDGIKKLTSNQVRDIILAIENSNFRGLELAGKFIHAEYEKMTRGGRVNPLTRKGSNSYND